MASKSGNWWGKELAPLLGFAFLDTRVNRRSDYPLGQEWAEELDWASEEVSDSGLVLE